MTALFVGGAYHNQILDLEDIKANLPIVGYTEDLTILRNAGRLVHRTELDNQPIVEGYLSPMWDGGRLRYETQEVYDMLSN